MKVEVLYFDGCPNHEALLPHLRELLASDGASADIELVRVEDADAAERERVLGSPTVRIDGEDVEPGADRRTDYGLKCRLFQTSDGLRGMPADEWVLAALERSRARSTSCDKNPAGGAIVHRARTCARQAWGSGVKMRRRPGDEQCRRRASSTAIRWTEPTLRSASPGATLTASLHS